MTRSRSARAVRGPEHIATNKRGFWLLKNPSTNKDLGFTQEERDQLGLNALLPPRICSIEEQVAILPHRGAYSACYALQLSASDDGIGIAPGAKPGLGLAGMEERVRALGGTFSVSSESDQGTRLSIAIPLEDTECQAPSREDSEVRKQ